MEFNPTEGMMGVHFEYDDEEDDEDLYNEAILESENFAVYSNCEFLFLIGKYAALSGQFAEEGLKALNDYLLLTEHLKNTFTESEYYTRRALSLFNIGCIFYKAKDYS